MSNLSRNELFDFQISTEEPLTPTAQLKTSDIDDILQKVIEEERQKAERARNLASAKAGEQSDDLLGVILIEIIPLSTYQKISKSLPLIRN